MKQTLLARELSAKLTEGEKEVHFSWIIHNFRILSPSHGLCRASPLTEGAKAVI